MLLFALRLSDRPDPGALRDALLNAARPFRHLDEDSLTTVLSRSGRLAIATVGHDAEVARPRRYTTLRNERFVAFDGLPIAPQGGFESWDARALLEHWDEQGDRLEGQFAAVRAELEEDRFECITDPLGLHPVYTQRLPDGWLVSNSVEVVRSLGHAREPDALGLSSFLMLGWASADRTLLDGVRKLEGGCRFVFDRHGMREHPNFTPGTIIREARRMQVGEEETADLTDALLSLTRTAMNDSGLPVTSAITAGRDTRVLLALCLAAGVTPDTSTIGGEDHPDVRGGRAVAALAGVPWMANDPEQTEMFDDAPLAARTFVSITDGLSSLLQLQDIGHVYSNACRRVGVQFWGVGGEFARPGSGALKSFAAMSPGLASSRTAITALMHRRPRDAGGILTAAAHSEMRAYMDRFIAERLEEGWRPGEIPEAFYAFERVARSSSSGIRRATAQDDLFTPFATRPYMTYAFALRPAERYYEAAHYRLLSRLHSQLRDFPFDVPWRPQSSRLALWQASVRAAREAVRRTQGRFGGGPSLKDPAEWVTPWVFQWFARHRNVHRDVCLSTSSTPLWEWLDRGEVERAFKDEDPTFDRMEQLLRVATVAWYFEGVPSRVAPEAKPVAVSVRAA